MSAPAAFVFRVRVYWEDTDAAGIVYYANYLRFLERARTEWLRVRGYDQNELAQRFGVAFVVRALALEYLKPARLDDELVLSLALTRAAAAALTLRQTVSRAHELLVEGSVELACVRIAAFQPTRIPRVLREAIVG